MAQITAASIINAPAEQPYGIIPDYPEGHPRILPKPYFQKLEVEEGGVSEDKLVCA